MSVLFIILKDYTCRVCICTYVVHNHFHLQKHFPLLAPLSTYLKWIFRFYIFVYICVYICKYIPRIYVICKYKYYVHKYKHIFTYLSIHPSILIINGEETTWGSHSDFPIVTYDNGKKYYCFHQIYMRKVHLHWLMDKSIWNTIGYIFGIRRFIPGFATSSM